ncbi:Ig-like domain-containing protein [Clostridium intestinale]|uniref:Cell adhesion domain-containing protein n=1 Tax=Clostridium intestinale URNW TaxID=1294142 RepID=U2PW07_9CLOT|nr:Ig-like domain-containing protein [Clostridium intestinale]ERK30610.1 cell adhesion domain-containing protein [Clostridium intestinale URNW]
MKVQSKKKFIAFSLVVILATIFSLTWMQGSEALAASVGQQSSNPDAGWKRFDDTDSKIKYIESSNGKRNDSYEDYNGTRHISLQGDKIIIKFYGSKFRIIATRWNDCGKNHMINIDGVQAGTFSNFSDNIASSSSVRRILVYEKNDLDVGNHTIEITAVGVLALDAIDIDDTGYLIDASTVAVNEISLNKTSLSLNVGQNEDLIATVKPDNAENKKVTWISSDESVATVDENGKVTATKAGNTTITAKTTDGSNLTATCTVTVVQPSNDRAILAITMTNGQTKEYDLPNSEIEAFSNWFDSSNGKGQPKFGFNKKIQPYKEVKEYVVFDKISSYEVRSYTVSN